MRADLNFERSAPFRVVFRGQYGQTDIREIEETKAKKESSARRLAATYNKEIGGGTETARYFAQKATNSVPAWEDLE